jgi:hypothetical protein
VEEHSTKNVMIPPRALSTLPATADTVDEIMLGARDELSRAYKKHRRKLAVNPKELHALIGLAASTYLDHHRHELVEADANYEAWFADAHHALLGSALSFTLVQHQLGTFMNVLTVNAWIREVPPNPRLSALLELNASSLAIANEVLLLLRHGFPAGAEARWRTIHEHAVIARLLSKRGRTLSKRYMDTRFTELRRMLRDGVLLPAPSRRNAEARTLAAEIEAKAAIAEREHGPELSREYGWAYPVVKKRRITFREVEAASGAAARRPAYQESSRRVHAGRVSSLSTLLVSGVDSFYVGRHFDNFVKPGLRTIWAVDEVVHLLLREVARATEHEVEALAWSQCLAQVATDADLEFRRAGMTRAIESGNPEAARRLMPKPTTMAKIFARDAAKWDLVRS